MVFFFSFLSHFVSFRRSSAASSGERRPREPRPVSPPSPVKRPRAERHHSTPEAAEAGVRHGYHQRRTPTPPQPPPKRRSPSPTSRRVGGTLFLLFFFLTSLFSHPFCVLSFQPPSRMRRFTHSRSPSLDHPVDLASTKSKRRDAAADQQSRSSRPTRNTEDARSPPAHLINMCVLQLSQFVGVFLHF